MFWLNTYLSKIYGVIAGLFLVGLMLRILRLYPGKEEPLILDLSAVIIAIIFAFIAHHIGLSNIRFILIMVSSLIIIPHIIYIVMCLK